ncbi:MAG TPA: hypothetical protein VM513_32945, partial [Kofleriaceae bacterium]|nr:hypothetical protein [Kofleriaceae bacterium]
MRPGSSTLELSMAGTIAVHLIFVVLADVVRVYNPPEPPEPAPHIEMFDIELPPVVTEPPPPVAKVEEPPVQEEPVQPKVVTKPAAVRTVTKAVETPRQTTEPPPPTPPTTGAAGGDQVVTLDSAPPGATGVAVAVGRPNGGRVGRGGAGGGT